MKEHVKNFFVYLKNERGLSARTLQAYQRDLDQLLQFLEAEEIDRPEQVTQHHIRAFIAQRHRQGLGGKSLQRLLSAIRSLFRWMLREGLAEHNPATPVKAPKSPRHLPATLDADTIAQLLDNQSGPNALPSSQPQLGFLPEIQGPQELRTRTDWSSEAQADVSVASEAPSKSLHDSS